MDIDNIRQAIGSVRSFYEEQGIFMKQFGYGERPAMVIIDMAYGWTDPEYATGSARLDEAVEGIQSLLPVARAKHIPIIYTTYPPPRGEEEPMHTTDGAKQQYRVWDPHACEIDHRLAPLPADLIIYKENASAFFNTALITYLTEHHIDTSSSPAVPPAPASGQPLRMPVPIASKPSCPESAFRIAPRPHTSGTSSTSTPSSATSSAATMSSPTSRAFPTGPKASEFPRNRLFCLHLFRFYLDSVSLSLSKPPSARENAFVFFVYFVVIL